MLFAERPELTHALTDFYTYIGCPFDLNGEKSWWHGAVWHYDFCMGITCPLLPIAITYTITLTYLTHTYNHTYTCTYLPPRLKQEELRARHQCAGLLPHLLWGSTSRW